MPSPKRINVLVLDTGYSGPKDEKLNVIWYDFCENQQDFQGIRVGYNRRMDGTDSVANGHGTQICQTILRSLRESKVPMNFLVHSVKIGDSGSPLIGCTASAIKPALEWVMTLPTKYPSERWLVYLGWNLTAIGQLRSLLPQLLSAGIPVVIPAGDYFLDTDLLSSGGDKIVSYLPLFGNILTVSCLSERSNWGAKTVHLGVDQPNTYFAAALATVWVATSRFIMVSADAAGVISRVKSLVIPNPACVGKSLTGGILTGVPH